MNRAQRNLVVGVGAYSSHSGAGWAELRGKRGVWHLKVAHVPEQV